MVDTRRVDVRADIMAVWMWLGSSFLLDGVAA